jgi:hypothetical protein
VSPLPNLVVTAVSSSSPVVIGGPIDLDQSFTNNGTANAGPFFVQFVLSTDAVFSLDDIALAFCDIGGGLSTGASGGCGGTLTFNLSPPPGNYRILAIIDSAFEVVEGNEGDNLTATAGTIEICQGQCAGSACGCNQTSPVNEDLTTCIPPVADTWIFDIAAGESISIQADTVDAGTAADLAFSGSCTSGDGIGGDDELSCTFPPPVFACPQSNFVASGAGQCTLNVTLASNACANPATANYQLRVQRNGADAAIALIFDDQ